MKVVAILETVAPELAKVTLVLGDVGVDEERPRPAVVVCISVTSVDAFTR